MRASSLLATCASALRGATASLKAPPLLDLPLELLQVSLPALLDKSAAVLERAPMPASLLALSFDDVLALVPICGSWFVLGSFAIAAAMQMAAAIQRWRRPCSMAPPPPEPKHWLARVAARATRRAQRARAASTTTLPPPTYWLTRLVVLRGMGLVFLAAFGTSAAQSRGLFGSHGLSPVLGTPSGRPTPVFDVLGRSDLALELMSWAGVLLSLLLLTGVLTWAPLPALLWAMQVRLVHACMAALGSAGEHPLAVSLTHACMHPPPR